MPLQVDFVIPVLNEEEKLRESVETLCSYLKSAINNPWRIVIADNGSEDNTPLISRDLSRECTNVTSLRLEVRGRGRALRQAWLATDADLVSYMDVDLSTDLTAVPCMIKALESGYDVAVGSRLIKGARVYSRTVKREIISRSYNYLIKALFLNKFTDAQCGFKAMTREAAALLLPSVKDQGWFFDTELLIVAEKNGLKIKDIPVIWTDDPDSRVKLISTVWRDLNGLLRLRLGGVPKLGTRV